MPQFCTEKYRYWCVLTKTIAGQFLLLGKNGGKRETEGRIDFENIDDYLKIKLEIALCFVTYLQVFLISVFACHYTPIF